MKHFFIGLISVSISVLICALLLSFCIKEIAISTLSREVVSKEISNNIIIGIKDFNDDISYDTLNEIETNVINSDVINKITEKYFDSIILLLTKDEQIVVPKTSGELLSLIDENESILNDNGIYIVEEDKEKIVNGLTSEGKMDRVYKNVVNNVKNNLSSKEIKVIKAYNMMITNNFRVIITSAIVILTLIIALVKRTYYRWTYNLGISFALSGITLSLLIPFMSNLILSKLGKNMMGRTLEINLNSMVNLGYICFVLCALLIIIYITLNKITRYNDEKYE